MTTRPRSAGPGRGGTLNTLDPCGAGLDFPKDTVYAGVRRCGPGGTIRTTIQVFGTR